MKKALLIALALFVVSVPASAQQLSLWSDEAMTSCSVTTAGPYTPFPIYVFLEPGPEGAFAVEYKLTTPAGHFSPAGNVINPVVSGATIGVWYGAPGISAPFTSCQVSLFWVIMLNMMAPNTTPGHYAFALNDDSNFMGVAICPDPRPLADAIAINEFGFNADCVVGTEESSWGAIKNMME
jgi:hypothetical protein